MVTGDRWWSACIGWNFMKERSASVATARAWDIKGPPCPALSEADWIAKRYKAEKHFDYDGVDIGRHAGNASCSDVQDKGGTGFRHHPRLASSPARPS